MTDDDPVFTVRLAGDGEGPRLAVKDCIDIAGLVTTCGCEAIASGRAPAVADASCVANARVAGARIVGKTNLHELMFGVTGINAWSGTPTNPRDASLVPGGSSSGSAVAVATGEADIAYGTDTAGSCRIPAACCGVAGMMTTAGRIALDGVMPLAPTFDALGALARDVRGLVVAMQLLERGFTIARAPSQRIGRVAVPADGAVDVAIDGALSAAGIAVVDAQLDGWHEAGIAATLLLLQEAWEVHGHLLERREQLGADIVRNLEVGSYVSTQQREDAEVVRRKWRAAVSAALERAPILALPTLPAPPPRIEDAAAHEGAMVALTGPVNLAGLPAVSIPVTAGGAVPAGLQLLAAPGEEELLLATAARIASAQSLRPAASDAGGR